MEDNKLPEIYLFLQGGPKKPKRSQQISTHILGAVFVSKKHSFTRMYSTVARLYLCYTVVDSNQVHLDFDALGFIDR